MDKPQDKQVINVMTSSDEKLMPFIMTQLMSIVDNLPNNITINYFLLYDTKENKEAKLNNIEILHKFSSNFNNLFFNDIDIGDTEIFEHIAEYGGIWPSTAYYPVLAHKFLPENVDRVLYLDAGDVFVMRDFREFYFADFSNNLILATSTRYKIVDNELAIYDGKDLYDLDLFDGITRGLFNSGSYVMNIKLIRQVGIEEDYCIKFADVLNQMKADVTKRVHEYTYWGDQGFLSALFVGKVKYYGCPHVKNIWYMPFNFCLWYFDRMEIQPWYNPIIIHFAGAPKPWNMKYSYNVDFQRSNAAFQSIGDLKLGQREYYYIWHEYAIKSEIICRTNGILT